jgi:hypothetical protein
MMVQVYRIPCLPVTERDVKHIGLDLSDKQSVFATL